jgi:hypothetical protein
MSRHIGMREVQSFIRHRLKSKLFNDFTRIPFRIFRERDLHACCYHHLRRFLDGDHTWEILNEPYLKNLKGRGKSAMPDMVLLRHGKPRLLLEFKFRRRGGGLRTKEQRVMRKAVKKGIARKAYYIEAVIDGSKQTQRKGERYVNHIMPLEMPAARKEQYLKKWRARRKPKVPSRSRKRRR